MSPSITLLSAALLPFWASLLANCLKQQTVNGAWIMNRLVKIVNIDSAEHLHEITRGHSLRPASKQHVTAFPDSWSWANTAPSSFVTIQSVSFRDDSHTRMLKHIKRRTDSFPCIKMSVSWINLSMTQAFVEYFPVSGACWNRTTTRRLGFRYSNESVHFMHKRSHPSKLTAHREYAAHNLTFGAPIFPPRGQGGNKRHHTSSN